MAETFIAHGPSRETLSVATSRSQARPLLTRKGVEVGLIGSLFLALTLLMTWPWALHITEAINPFGDVVLQMAVLRWDAHALATNPLGLFEAPFFYPYAHSITFSEHLLGETISTLPVLWLTDNPGLAFNLNVLSSFVLTGLFMYLLVRDLTGSRVAGLLAGLAFAFCPFRFMQMGHLHMLATQWIPFTLWALSRALRRRGPHPEEHVQSAGMGQSRQVQPLPLRDRWLAWATFGYIANCLSSVYYTFFLSIAVALYIAYWIATALKDQELREWVPWGRLLSRLGLAALVAGVVLAPVLIPYAQTAGELGLSRSTYEVDNWSAELAFYGQVMHSNWLYGQALAPHMASSNGERELFPGIIPTLLALIGVAWGRGREKLYYLLLGLFSFVLTFGLSFTPPGTTSEVPLPYALLYDWLPGFKALRVPVRFDALVDLSLYVLAGFGVAGLLQRISRQSSHAKARRFSIAIAGRIALVGALIMGIMVEFANPLDVSNRLDVAAQIESNEPYVWLARPENSGTILELPFAADQPDVWYMLFGTRHWQPVIDGWSGIVPPGTVRLKQSLAQFPDAESLALLQGLEVRHVVIHLWQYPREAQADLIRRLNGTSQLKLADRTGEDYVYELAPDPWLRKIATEVGSGTLWVGEARHGSMPALEVLAYALKRWGLGQAQIGGNIDIGYMPLGPLPFGSAADYALLPNTPGAGGTPFGLESMQPVMENGAVRLLKRDKTLIAAYELTGPGAPQLDPGRVEMRVGSSGISFGGDTGQADKAARTLSLDLLAFSPSEITLELGEQVRYVSIPEGLSRYTFGPLSVPAEVVLTRGRGDVRLLRADLYGSEGTQEPEAIQPYRGLMPLEVTPSRGADTLDAHLRVAAPADNGGDFTATIDVYKEPWGTHPEGHFGSWSVVLSADGGAHDYMFRLRPEAKEVVTTRDGKAVKTFSWKGPPEEGDFRATLSIRRGQSQVANIPLYLFNMKQGKQAEWQPEGSSLLVVRVSDK